MDSFKADLQKVALDDNIGAELRLKLPNVKVPCAVIRNDSNTDFDTIKNHFKIVCRTRAAAIILNYPSLDNLFTYMCQILDFAAYCKYKKRMRFEPNMQHVLGTVTTIVESWIAFLETVGEKDEVEHRKVFNKVIAKAKEGDEEIVERLGLEEPPDLRFRTMEKTEPIYILRHQYQHVYDQLLVATYMKDTLKKNLCATLMGYIMWIQNEVYPKETLKLVNIDHRDLASSMQEEIEMLMRVIRKIELAVRAECIQQAEDAVAEIEDEIDDQARDPTYVEETDSEAEEARDPSYVGETDIESDISEQIPLSTTLRTKKQTKPAEPAKEPQKRKRPSEDSAGSTDNPLKRARPDKTTKRSHHRKRLCPVCGKEDANLKRYLKSHARMGHIENQQVDKLF